MEFYAKELPDFLKPFLNTPSMQRLQKVGMNCGCEYTSFPRFSSLPEYSRYTHSLGAALIVWNFSSDPVQTLAALFHDISTPTFAHSIDFLHRDYLNQESTEAGTEQVIRSDAVLCTHLDRLGISVDSVRDYHRYPIADNDSPRLSADRLEYTLGNLLRYGFRDMAFLRRCYEDLTVSIAEDGLPELCFQSEDTASRFAVSALNCARVYVAPEDRYSMQMLAELLQKALDLKILSESDFMGTEDLLIGKLLQSELASAWNQFRAMHRMVSGEEADPQLQRIIPAKKRYIDPYVIGKGRVSSFCDEFRRELDAFLSESQEELLCAVSYMPGT